MQPAEYLARYMQKCPTVRCDGVERYVRHEHRDGNFLWLLSEPSDNQTTVLSLAPPEAQEVEEIPTSPRGTEPAFSRTLAAKDVPQGQTRSGTA